MNVERMQAAQYHEVGDPEVLRLGEMDRPQPQNDEVLIRVHASSVNGIDLRLRRHGGPPALFGPLPRTPGFDVAGEVVGLGPRVTAFDLGDPVYTVLGIRGGGAAQYVAVSQERVAAAPRRVELTGAAAVPLAGLTALQALRDVAGLHLRAGQRVLVYGASGGTGAYGVQLAKHYGCFVTGVARGAKLDFVRGLGADEVLDSEAQDFTQGGEQWDVVLDTSATLNPEDVLPAVRRGGICVSTRHAPMVPGSGPDAPSFSGVDVKERGLDLALLSRLIDAGALTVPLDRTFALAEIAQAHRYAEERQVRGKIVVTVE